MHKGEKRGYKAMRGKEEDCSLLTDEEMPESVMSPGSLSMVIPIYNEVQSVDKVLKGIKDTLRGMSISAEIIVVDDGSTDGTLEVLKGIEDIQVIENRRNMGYGAAIKRGMREARHGWIGTIDADGSYDSQKIPELFSAMRQNDMVVGARVGENVRIPLLRRPAKWILNLIANFLIRQKIPDLNSGLRIFKKGIAEEFLNILPDGFSFSTTITLTMLFNNHEVLFVPVSYMSRMGKSKIRPIYHTMDFFQLIVRTILYFDPLRVFFPLGLMLFLTAATLFILRLIEGGGYAVTIPMFVLAGIQIMAIGFIADLIGRRTKP